MAITTSHLSKKISADIKENLLPYINRFPDESTIAIPSIEEPIDDSLFTDKELEVSFRSAYETLNHDNYKERIEQDIIRNPTHLIDVKKTRTISLEEAILKLNKSNELYEKEWDDYRTQKAELLELYEDEENSE